LPGKGAGKGGAQLSQRWRHVQGVARRASQISPSVVGSDDTLVCAAWLHDIGYAPALVATGFHPLDGARFLESVGASRRLAGLVAHHSFAVLEAELRGLADELAEFDDEDGAVRDALWYCDITTSPDGAPVAAADRIAEIKRRYGPGHLVTRFITQATPGLLAAIGRTEQVLGEAASS
jgi:HD domain